MASFFYLTLDTVSPAGVTAALNDNALYTTSATVTLKTTTTDTDTNGYQMKIWGIDGVADEATATWEAFVAEKSITLPGGDGLKTVHVKLRDRVGNESAEATDDITLNTVVPVVSVTGPDRDEISARDGFAIAVVNFTVDVAFDEYKVCYVPGTTSTQDAGVVIGTTHGSVNTSGAAGGYPAATNIEVKIHGADLEVVAGSGEEPKCIKIFVRTAAGIWSVA